MAEDRDRSRTTLAVVGVVATAAVGIAGATTTLLVSRDQRATERANRIYERRATAYVEALDTLEGHVSVLSRLTWSSEVLARRRFEFNDVQIDEEKDAPRIRTRVVAFGTADTIAAFNRVGALDRKAFAWIYGEEQPVERDPNKWFTKTNEAIQELRAGVSEFERELNRELTS